MIAAIQRQSAKDAGRGTPPGRSALRAVIFQASALLTENGIESARLDARLIVAHALGLTPIDTYRNPDLPVDPALQSAIIALTQRRISGVPIAYIVGTKEFWSLSIAVDERVLIPRPETEILVEETLTAARMLPKDIAVLEIGAGSGAVSIALAMELTGARIVSTDVSRDALSVAETNVSAHGLTGRIVLKQGDLFAAVGREDRFDLIVSNPPYLTGDEMGALPSEVRTEPELALRGGKDGLSVIERIVEGAPDRLNAGGFLILEIGAGHEYDVRQLIERTRGLSVSRTRCDYAGHPRVVIAQCINQ